MNTILKVENLYLKNRDTEILKNISFDIKQGEILGIVGESGCGKSTLIRALIQMMNKSETITKGKIYFKNRDITKMSSKELRKLKGKEIGIIFQNPGDTLNPIRKIGTQFIEVFNSHQNISKKEALLKTNNLLKKIGLNDCCILDSYPFELSGGMKQRIATALAMVMEPDLLIADEPTSALDVTIQVQVVNEMINLRSKFDTSIIIVTHSMGVVSRMADKVAVMYAGKIIEYGPKDEILNNPKHPYTKALINAIPRLDGKLPVGIPGSPPSFKDNIKGCSFAPRCKYSTNECRVLDQELIAIENNRFIACTQIKKGAKKHE